MRLTMIAEILFVILYEAREEGVCWKVHLVASLALFWMHKECLFGMNRAVFDYVQGLSVWYEQGCV